MSLLACCSARWQALNIIWRSSLHGLVFFVISLAVAGTANFNGIAFSQIELSIDGESYQRSSLPIKQNIRGDYRVRISAKNTNLMHRVRIFPDDELLSLSVNGQPVSLERFTRDQLRDYSGGFAIDLSFDRVSTHVIEARLRNESNPAGFDIQPENILTLKQSVVLALLLIAYATFLSFSFALGRGQLIVIALSLVACVMYLSVTGERERIFDVYEGGGHKDYIEYIIDKQSLPNPGDGWEYHQPPLYYGLAALAKVVAVSETENGDLWGRMHAMVFWVIFIVVANAALRVSLVGGGKVLLLASALLCFWPAGIIHSVRIGNDLPLYAFLMISFYYSLIWWRNRKLSTIFWASLWMMVAIFTKSNGLIMTAVLGSLIICLWIFHGAKALKNHHFWSVFRQKISPPALVLTSCFIAGVALNLGDNIYKYAIGEAEDWLLSNVGSVINPGLKVDNGIENYLIFDMETYITSPFMSTWTDEYGRQYFWNFLIRSSLTSEFFFEGFLLSVWGVFNGIMLFLLLAILLYRLLSSVDTVSPRSLLFKSYKIMPWHLLWAFSLIFLLAYRIKVPVSCNTDFRYIYPMLVAVVFFMAQSALKPGPIAKLTQCLMAFMTSSTLVWLALLIYQ